MAEQQDVKQGGGLSQALKMATGVQRADEGQHGKDDLIGEHPAMKLPDDSRDKLGASAAPGGQTVTGTGQDKTGVPATRQDTDQAPLSDEQSQTTTGGAGPEVLKSEANLSPDQNQNTDASSKASSSSRVDAITKHLNAATLHEKGTVEDDDLLDDFRPHILHKPHPPCPMAMVNRAPRGSE